jgi:oligopeptide/dipeptide ABC transporter ATP-binding protein
MYLGRMVETGPKEILYTSPLHPYTRALITSAPTLKKKTGALVGLIRGEVWDVQPPANGCVFFPRCPLAAPDCERAVPQLVDKGNCHGVACWRA